MILYYFKGRFYFRFLLLEIVNYSVDDHLAEILQKRVKYNDIVNRITYKLLSLLNSVSIKKYLLNGGKYNV